MAAPMRYHVFFAAKKILSRTAFASSFTRCQVNAYDSLHRSECIGYVDGVLLFMNRSQ